MKKNPENPDQNLKKKLGNSIKKNLSKYRNNQNQRILSKITDIQTKNQTF
jgi:hypothetical protein